MSKFKFTIQNILFWVGIISTWFLLENISILTPNPTSSLSDAYFYILLAVSLVALIAYNIFDRILNKGYADQFLLAIILICFATTMVAIWGFKEFNYKNAINPSKSFIYTLFDYEKIKQSLVSFVYFFAIYSFLFVFSKNHPSYKRIYCVYLIVILLCYGLLAHSLVTEFSKYLSVLNGVSPSEPILSLFHDNDFFALLMLLGMFSSVSLNSIKKNPFSFITIVIFSLALILIGSQTFILIDVFFLLVYFFVETIFDFKKKVALGVVSLTSYIVIFASIFIMYSLAQQYNFGAFSNFARYVHDVVLVADYPSYLNRMQLWNDSVAISNNNIISILFGYGFRNSGPLLGLYHQYFDGAIVYNGLATSENAGLQILVNFGYFGVLTFSLLVIYFVFCVFRLAKKEARFAIVSLFVGLGVIASGITMSIFPLLPNTLGFLTFLMFFLPVISHYKHVRKEKLQLAIIENVKTPVDMLDVKLRIKGLAKVFMGCSAAIASLFVFNEVRDGEYQHILLNILVALGALTIFAPYIVGLWSKNTSRTRFVIRAVINILISTSLFITLYVLMNKTKLFDDISFRNMFYPILLGVILLMEFVIYSIAKKGRPSEFGMTFVGISKFSFMGLIGVSLSTLAVYFIQPYLELSILTLIVIGVFNLLIYFIFSYFVPFKDVKEIVKYYNDVDASRMKDAVLDEKLRLSK